MIGIIKYVKMEQIYMMIYLTIYVITGWLVAWFSGNIVGHINKVTRCWGRLVLRWVTVHRYTILVLPARVVAVTTSKS